MYSRNKMQNLGQEFQTPLSHKQTPLSAFLIVFLKYAWNLEHFQKKMSMLAALFSKLLILKDVAT